MLFHQVPTADPQSGVWLFLVALIVILIIAWYLSRSAAKPEDGQAIAEYAKAHTSTNPQAAIPPVEQTQPDDLKKIEGIGPKLSSVLSEAGLTTFTKLATASVEEIQAILDQAGVARISSPETWAEQAKIATQGDWDALQKLQDSLKGGRRS